MKVQAGIADLLQNSTSRGITAGMFVYLHKLQVHWWLQCTCYWPKLQLFLCHSRFIVVTATFVSLPLLLRSHTRQPEWFAPPSNETHATRWGQTSTVCPRSEKDYIVLNSVSSSAAAAARTQPCSERNKMTLN